MRLTETTRLKSLSVQFIQIPAGVILKRGCTELRISGEGIAQVVQQILHRASTCNATLQEIRDQFAHPKRQAVYDLIDQLVAKRILVAADDGPLSAEGPESSLEIFYWHFGEPASQVTAHLNNHHVAILGVNCISRQLALSLSACGMVNVEIIDFPLLRNLRLFDESGHLNLNQWIGNLPLDYEAWTEKIDQNPPTCLVATSDFGAHEAIRELNSLCVERNYHFLPVVLQNLVGFLGPFVVPGETACFECLRARQNSNFNDPEIERATEATSFQGQSFIGYHPSMASILGDIAAFEVTRFYGGVLPKRNVGCLLEINLLAMYMTSRKVLKVPRCLVCSPLNRTAPIEPTKTTTSGR
jgi:molybdopterin-synthase adenylyltransferase